jgi:hypothetical protein
MKQDRHLYGLAPLDFTPEQIKKIPSPILWRHSREDVRFEDELLSRIKKISDVRNEIELYSQYSQEDITSSPRLIELINKLAPNEENYSTLQPFFNVLNDDNKRYVMGLFLETGRSGLLYERFLDVVYERYKHIDPNSRHLIKIIFELLEEKRPRPLVLYLIGHLSNEKFDEIYPILKKKAPNSILGCLLYFTSYVPEEDHLLILKTMSKLTGLYNIKDKQFKVLINPLLLKELSLVSRLQVLKNISVLKSYPFSQKASMSYVKTLLFPLIFNRAAEIEMILRNWEVLDKTAPPDLLECTFMS